MSARSASLTPKQERFAQVYLETGNASEAYRRAYDASAMKDEAIHVNASKLLANAKVALRVRQLQESARGRHDITLDGLTAMLVSDRDMARTEKRPDAAIRAVMGLARIHGFLINKHEVGGPDGQPLADMASSRDVARAIISILREAPLAPSAPEDAEGDELGETQSRGAVDPEAFQTARYGAFVLEQAAEEARKETDVPAATTPSGSPAKQATNSRFAHGDSKVFDNGASLTFDGERQKFAVFNPRGEFQSWRRDHDAAVAFAQSLN